jgi:aspartyl-tRNA(Asn)/glutamyl-tRNA(Gln) amidotransferase subunit A
VSAQSFAADPGTLGGAPYPELLRGLIDPVLLLKVSLARIDAVERSVQGFRLIDRDGAMARAERLRQEAASGRVRGPLHGVPVAIKDVIDVAGFPTRAGSKTREGIAASTADATVVAQLRAAGAVIVGKAHTTEFAFFEGPPPTRNPHDLTRTPGGSSSGPAAVVAAGMVPLSVGTQTAGSVSRPAAYCGIAAFKPSTLGWPAFGIVPFAPSFDTPGVFAYRVADATAAARVLMQPFLQATAAPAALRLAVVDDPVLEAASGAVRATIQSATEKLRAAGRPVSSFPAPIPLGQIAAWHKTMTDYELARAHPFLAASNDVAPGLAEAGRRGAAIADDDYETAVRAIAAARVAFWSAAEDFDALIFPAAPDIAPVGTKTGDPRFIIPFTALGGPIVSVPLGFDQGLPLGLMLCGAPGTDSALADIADRIAPLIELAR